MLKGPPLLFSSPHTTKVKQLRKIPYSSVSSQVHVCKCKPRQQWLPCTTPPQSTQPSFIQPQKHAALCSCTREAISFVVKAGQPPSDSSTGSLSQDRSRRRQVISIGATTTAPLAFLLNQHSYSCAAEDKKGFLSVLDKKDGYSFLYPFGWQAPNYTRHALSTVSIGNGMVGSLLLTKFLS